MPVLYQVLTEINVASDGYKEETGRYFMQKSRRVERCSAVKVDFIF